MKAEAPVEPEPKLAAEILAREEIVQEAESVELDTVDPASKVPPAATAEPKRHLDALKPPITIAVTKMSRFSQRVSVLV